MTKSEYIDHLRTLLSGDIIPFINSISAGGQLNINDESDVELLDNVICGQKQTDLCFIDRTTAYQAVAIVLSKQAPAIADFIETKSNDMTYVDFDLSDYCPIIGKGFHMVNQKILFVSTTSTGIMLGRDDSELGFNIISAFPVINDAFTILSHDCVSVLEQTETYCSEHISNFWRLAARATCGDPLLQEFYIQYKPSDGTSSEQLIISRKPIPENFNPDSITLYCDDRMELLKSCTNTSIIVEPFDEDENVYRSISKRYKSFASFMERDPALVRFTMYVIEQFSNLKIIRKQVPPDEPDTDDTAEDTPEEQSDEEDTDEPTSEPKPVPRYSEMPTGPVKQLADHKLFPAQNYNDDNNAPIDYAAVPSPKDRSGLKRGPTRPKSKPFGLKDIT